MYNVVLSPTFCILCRQMISNTVSSFEMLQKPERQTSIEEKRKYVVAELLETEKSYVEALKMIQEVSMSYICRI